MEGISVFNGHLIHKYGELQVYSISFQQLEQQEQTTQSKIKK